MSDDIQAAPSEETQETAEATEIAETTETAALAVAELSELEVADETSEREDSTNHVEIANAPGRNEMPVDNRLGSDTSTPAVSSISPVVPFRSAAGVCTSPAWIPSTE